MYKTEEPKRVKVTTAVFCKTSLKRNRFSITLLGLAQSDVVLKLRVHPLDASNRHDVTTAVVRLLLQYWSRKLESLFLNSVQHMQESPNVDDDVHSDSELHGQRCSIPCEYRTEKIY